MILLLNPRATKPENRHHQLSVLAIAAVLEGREGYAIVHQNVDDLSEIDVCVKGAPAVPLMCLRRV